jgi:hypothetical protein
MSQFVYTATMARYASNAAEILAAEHLSKKGRVDLKELFELIMTSRAADDLIKVFQHWHRMVVASANNASGKLISMTITNEPAIIVAGQLNEFSRAVNQIVDTANTLVDAAKIVEQYGHCKRATGGFASGFCILGAVESVVQQALTPGRQGGRTHVETLWSTALDTITQQLKSELVIQWNDDPRTTAQDVIRVLRAGASDIVTVKL